MSLPAADVPEPSWLSLLDWRQQVSALYTEVRRLRPHDPLAAHAHWTRGRDRLFGQHPQSPLPAQAQATFGGLPVWPYDPALAVQARVIPLPEERLSVPSSTGQAMPLIRFGRVALPGLPGAGSPDSTAPGLDVYWIDVYGGGVFVPFRDASSGQDTYGGGRYLLDTVKGADLGHAGGGELILDFNFAYHPSCFYDSRWSCPLAPPANRLPFAVHAGERVARPEGQTGPTDGQRPE